MIDVLNHNGFKAGTTFQMFFDGNARMVGLVSGQNQVSWQGGAFADMGSVKVNKDLPKGQKLEIVADSSLLGHSKRHKFPVSIRHRKNCCEDGYFIID